MKFVKKYLPNRMICGIIIFVSGDGGMADALDSGSSGSNPVRVQVPFSALNQKEKPLKIQLFSMVFSLHISEMGQIWGKLRFILSLFSPAYTTCTYLPIFLFLKFLIYINFHVILFLQFGRLLFAALSVFLADYSAFSFLGFASTIRLISSKISCSLCPFSSHHSMTSLISFLSISSICSPFPLSGY